MSRQRLRPGMLEATTQPCPHCHGTGHTRSDDSLALSILRELEEEGGRKRSKEVLVKVPFQIANYILNQKREHVAMIEQRFGLSVRVEGDPHKISPEYEIEKFKVASRFVPEPVENAAIRLDSLPMPDEDEDIGELVEDQDDDDAEAVSETPRSDAKGEDRSDGDKKRRRRRRRRGGAGRNRDDSTAQNGDAPLDVASAAPAMQTTEQPKPKSRSRSRSRNRKPDSLAISSPLDDVIAAPEADSAPIAVPEQPAVKKSVRSRKKPEPLAEFGSAIHAEKVVPLVSAPAPLPAEMPQAAPTAKKPRAKPAAKLLAEPEPIAEAEPDAPKRRGWWSKATGR